MVPATRAGPCPERIHQTKTATCSPDGARLLAPEGAYHAVIGEKMKPALRTNDAALKAQAAGCGHARHVRCRRLVMVNRWRHAKRGSSTMSSISYTRSPTEQPRVDLPTGHSAHASWPLAATLRAFCVAPFEGFASCRQYQQLQAKGVAHDAALGTALLNRPLHSTKAPGGRR